MLAFFYQDMVHDFQAKMQLHKGNTIATRVHAEILLADLFSRTGFEFVDGDKYVDCSKGARYCCASYFDMHHKDLVKPASHNKVILGWRGTEANPASDKMGLGRQKLLKMENKMN
jgi:hypothetical protein